MKSSLPVIITIFVTACLSGYLGFHLARNDSSIYGQMISPLPAQVLSPPKDEGGSSTPTPTEKPIESGIGKVVQTALAGTSGTYAVVVKDLTTGETYVQNDHRQFEAASLYKLWVMAEAFVEIQSGSLDPNEVLSGNIADLNTAFNISPESAELTEGYVSLSVSDALSEMITISHNYAALLLVQRMGLPRITAFLAAHHLTQSSVGESPQTTAADVAVFFDQLYSGRLANAAGTSQMLTLLKSQTLNDKLPKYLPPGIVIAHKTGELDDVTHDAGIVYSPKATYIIVVLTQSGSPPDAQERISQVSQAVYNYFNP
jgi:beta-lactamase class A